MTGSKLLWEGYTLNTYSFSLRNLLRDNVTNVYCFVIFYDTQGEPIEVDVVHFRDPIPAGLAKRVNSRVHGSVRELTTRDGSKAPHTKVAFRILDFDIIE